MNAYELRNTLTGRKGGIHIPRQVFEAFFRRTNETVVFTFNGWDGKSYDGESRRGRVLTCTLPGCEEMRFVKVGRGIHLITDSPVVEKATGESHPEVWWVVDVK